MQKWRGKIEEIHPRVSARPWSLSHDSEEDTIGIIDDDGLVVIEDIGFAELYELDAEHIVKCVNEYELAIKEIEKLQNEVAKLNSIMNGLMATICEALEVATKEEEHK